MSFSQTFKSFRLWFRFWSWFAIISQSWILKILLIVIRCKKRHIEYYSKMLRTIVCWHSCIHYSRQGPTRKRKYNSADFRHTHSTVTNIGNIWRFINGEKWLTQDTMTLLTYRISSYSFLPWILSSLNSYLTPLRKLFKFLLRKGKLNAETIWKFKGFTIPKKNSCRGNYMRKYSICYYNFVYFVNLT